MRTCNRPGILTAVNKRSYAQKTITCLMYPSGFWGSTEGNQRRQSDRQVGSLPKPRLNRAVSTNQRSSMESAAVIEEACRPSAAGVRLLTKNTRFHLGGVTCLNVCYGASVRHLPGYFADHWSFPRSSKCWRRCSVSITAGTGGRE